MPTYCKYENCKSLARYGFKYGKAEYCKEHGLIMNAYPTSSICRCGKEFPSYGFSTDKRVSCCSECKKDGMIFFKKRKCEEINCKSSAKCFDYPGGEGKYCPSHKKDGMINIKPYQCIQDGCNKSPAYGLPNERPLYCAEHKKDSMIDMKHTICKENNCNIINPLFDISGGKGSYCEKHKKENMIDVRNKRCKFDGCLVRRTYGYQKQSPEYCNLHKKEDMIDLVSTRCQHQNCDAHPSFNYEHSKERLYCLQHKKEGMINVSSKYCPGPPGLEGPKGKCPFEKCGNPKYNYYCSACFQQAFPNDPRSLLVHKKSDEILVRDFINLNFKEYSFVHDTPMWINGCDCSHKRRVDLRALIGNTILAIEVDEYQHKDRDAIDEQIRYDDLYMIHSGKWIFIRYNPHLYKDETQKRTNPQKEKRLRILKDEVNKQIDRINTGQNQELIEIHNLFFDGYTLPKEYCY